MEFPYPSAGLVSSARDFAKFSEMLLAEGTLDGAQILPAKAAILMMSNLLPDGVKANGQGWGVGGLGMIRGTYGWQVRLGCSHGSTEPESMLCS